MASPSGYRYSPDGQSGSSSLSTHPLKAHACDSSQSMLQDYYVHPQPIKKKKKKIQSTHELKLLKPNTKSIYLRDSKCEKHVNKLDQPDVGMWFHLRPILVLDEQHR